MSGPTPLASEWARAQAWMSRMRPALRGKPAEAEDVDVMRVNQLDAAELDGQLHVMLSYQLRRAISYVRPGWLNQFKPELEALLRALVFRYTIFEDKASPGNELQNLRVRNEWSLAGAGAGAGADDDVFTLWRRQKLLYALAHVGLRWGWARLEHWMLVRGWGGLPDDDWRRWCYTVCRRLEYAYRIASVVNFVAFLVNGKYRSLLDRALGLRLVYARSRIGRQLDFEYMNQQLVWHGFSEFLLFIMPLINFARIKRFFQRLFLPEVDLAESDARECPHCSKDPLVRMPYAALPCRHLFCYYCLEGSRLAEAIYRCPRCNVIVMGSERHDVGGGHG